MTKGLYFIDGQFVNSVDASLPITDLAIQRGYGIFDFLRVIKGRPLFLEDHLDRFYQSAAKMHLTVSYTREQLVSIIFQLIEKNPLDYAGIRFTLTGGPSPDAYTIIAPSLVITIQPLTPPAATLDFRPYKLVTFEHQRQLPSVKTIDYLMAIWLQPWIKTQSAADVLYRHNGLLTECPRANFYMLTKDNVVVTPDANVLQGVTRKHFIKAISEDFFVEERPISWHELQSAKGAFITSSTKRLIPVTQVDDMTFDDASNSLITSLFNKLMSYEEAQLLQSY